MQKQDKYLLKCMA